MGLTVVSADEFGLSFIGWEWKYAFMIIIGKTSDFFRK